MTAAHWARVERPDQVVPVGAAPLDRAAERLSTLLAGWADQFGVERLGAPGLELRPGSRGILADEAASFLRALDAGLVEVDLLGGVTVLGCRRKPVGGRYSLFSANRNSGDPYVSLNTEYLIQVGAACELAAFHGWKPADVEIEVGEFDAIAHIGGRVVLTMEAKARIEGPDSLSGLWAAFVQLAAEDQPPKARTNHTRKYVELLRLAEAGPVALWLVAAQARWLVRVERVGSRLQFAPVAVEPPDRHAVLAMVGNESWPCA